MLLGCIHKSFYRCLEFHEPQDQSHVEAHLICGVINTGFDIKPAQWNIQVYSSLQTSIQILHFHVPTSHQCQKASLRLSSRTESQQYCGKLAPFAISFAHNQVKVGYNEIFDFYYGYHAVLYYEGVYIIQNIGYKLFTC